MNVKRCPIREHSTALGMFCVFQTIVERTLRG